MRRSGIVRGMNSLSRRSMLQLSVGTVSTLALSPSSLLAAEKKLKLSVAAYSFRNHFRFMKGKERKFAEPEMDMFKFLDFCADSGCDGAELTAYFFPPDADAAYFKKIRRHAKKKGVAVSGTAIGNNFSLEPGADRDAQMAYTKEWIDNAALMGAPHIRIFAGKQKKGTNPERADELVIKALKEACAYAGKKKIHLGLENHDSIATADRLIRLLNAVDSKWLGINLDSGNFRTADPYDDFERSVPHTVNVQMKTELKREGAKAKEESDLRRFIGLLKKGGYKGWVALEYEAGDNPYTAISPVLKELREHM
ncbi:MAG: sugar phosphate isomerase/epimerase [Yoonia sp.]|jgi:sugar phosphate isomerase/epimerase